MTTIELILSAAMTIVLGPLIFIATGALRRIDSLERGQAAQATAIAVAQERHTTHADDITEIKRMIVDLSRKLDRILRGSRPDPESDPP
jgi:hypothetical protein